MDEQSSNPLPPVGRRSPQPDATAPDGSEIRLLVDRRHLAEGASLCEVTLPAAQVSRPVWHRTVEEVWYFLEGRGQVWRCPPDADGAAVKPVSVGPGDALTIPVNWRFQFSASAEGPLRFLCYTRPPWPGPDEAQPAERGGAGTADSLKACVFKRQTQLDGRWRQPVWLIRPPAAFPPGLTIPAPWLEP